MSDTMTHRMSDATPLTDTVDELLALRKQAELDRQSREASQAEFARLNRELNEARETARKLGTMLDEAYRALGRRWP